MTTHTSGWPELTVIRTKDGHTLTTLAARVGCRTSTLHDFESGRRRPNEAMIRRLADALRVPYSVLEPRRPTAPERSAEDIAIDILTALTRHRAAQNKDTKEGTAA